MGIRTSSVSLDMHHKNSSFCWGYSRGIGGATRWDKGLGGGASHTPLNDSLLNIFAYDKSKQKTQLDDKNEISTACMGTG